MQTEEANYLNEKLKFLSNIKIKAKNNQKNELNEVTSLEDEDLC